MRIRVTRTIIEDFEVSESDGKSLMKLSRSFDSDDKQELFDWLHENDSVLSGEEKITARRVKE